MRNWSSRRFSWFDAAPDVFSLIDQTVARHTALRGNVETEIASDDDRNGCGCAYPESVPDADVERSNAILQRLREIARALEGHDDPLRTRLTALPMHLVAQVGDTRIGIVHGDARALAGWRFAHDSLHDARRFESIAALFEQAPIDGFASTHTCLPALKVFDTELGERFVINNGAADAELHNRAMACHAPQRSGTARLVRHPPLRRGYRGRLRTQWRCIRRTCWDDEFRRLWPPGPPPTRHITGASSNGPDFSIDDAWVARRCAHARQSD